MDVQKFGTHAPVFYTCTIPIILVVCLLGVVMFNSLNKKPGFAEGIPARITDGIILVVSCTWVSYLIPLIEWHGDCNLLWAIDHEIIPPTPTAVPVGIFFEIRSYRKRSNDFSH